MWSPKKVLAIFAHPDDESFGPGGTIALWANSGAQLHLLVATKGDHGKIPHIREQEVCDAAKVLGVKAVDFLDYRDGMIANSDLQQLENDLIAKVSEIQPDTILTFNLNGVSGHLDHIAVASATTQAFRKTNVAKRLYYYTLVKGQATNMSDYFIFFPEGFDLEDIDETIDVSSVWDRRIEAANQHKSQQQDLENVLEDLANFGMREHFLVRMKESTPKK